ncbi:MAG: hypothetical protein P4L65_04120 [Legionella sp.]|nr:hypothetical protein [Legionella sp.]
MAVTLQHHPITITIPVIIPIVTGVVIITAALGALAGTMPHGEIRAGAMQDGHVVVGDIMEAGDTMVDVTGMAVDNPQNHSAAAINPDGCSI